MEQAFLEAKSDLRHLIVATAPEGSFRDDSDFEKNSVHSLASAQLDSIELELTGLGEFQLCRCPKCKTIGELGTWFGTRVIRGRSVPQSYCRVCRTR